MKSFDLSVATNELPSIFMIYYPVREKIDPVIYLQVMQKLGSDLQVELRETTGCFASNNVI